MRKSFAPWVAPLTVAAVLFAPALATADSSTSLTVVGTSDVSDSGLMQNVIQPAFHAAYPSTTFKYTGTATGTAITDAETGSVGASVLIVHAASLENQFVAGGFSDEQYGRAIFTNDFVLAGPLSDPAGVSANAPNNIVQAFADVATAGIAGNATFVSRGGTPGTTVEEHQIWALMQSSGLAPAGLLLCTVNSTNGGGEVPIAAGNGVTANGQACPGSGAAPTGAALPSWYDVNTGATQGPNVVAANACTGAVSPSGTNRCYVLTDRGTYDYLASGTDVAGSIPALEIVTRTGPGSAAAPGGANELTNYFHAYIIKPTTTNGINLTAATEFMNLLTSPAVQAQLKTYLDDTSDPGGAPFVADASPTLTEIGLPTAGTAGKPVTVSGSLQNAEPGYPALASQKVSIDEIEAGIPVAVASGVTSATGTYSITFTPGSSGAYQVSTGQIAQIENSYFSPVFGDLLSPSATAEVNLTLAGLPMSHAVGFKKVTVRKGKLRLSGTVGPAPAVSGGSVQLYALRVTGKSSEKRVGTASIGAGKTSFTIKGKLARKATYVLQLKYVQKGQTSTYSGLKTLTVK